MIVGEARHLEEMIALLPTTHPEVAMIDDTIGSIEEYLPELKRNQVSLTLLTEEAKAIQTLVHSGLRGWGILTKTAESEEIVATVQAVAANLTVISREILPEFASNFPLSGANQSDDSTQEAGLTAREYEVLQLVAKGLPNKNIANQLQVSLSTVKFHVASILLKLNAGSRTEAVTTGARRGLVTL